VYETGVSGAESRLVNIVYNSFRIDPSFAKQVCPDVLDVHVSEDVVRDVDRCINGSRQLEKIAQGDKD